MTSEGLYALNTHTHTHNKRASKRVKQEKRFNKSIIKWLYYIVWLFYFRETNINTTK